jgi:hypothetical protein
MKVLLEIKIFFSLRRRRRFYLKENRNENQRTNIYCIYNYIYSKGHIHISHEQLRYGIKEREIKGIEDETHIHTHTHLRTHTKTHTQNSN